MILDTGAGFSLEWKLFSGRKDDLVVPRQIVPGDRGSG